MTSKKKALITGIGGQDGSFLAELLLEKGYEIHGVIRRSSVVNTERINEILNQCHIHYGDVTEGIDNILTEVRPDEVYNFAGMSHVGIAFSIPVYAMEVNALGVLKILEGIRRLNLKCKIYQASSSEMFGTTPEPQDETSPFNPVSPYGISKLCAYHFIRTYRLAYGMFACNGILFNHESERRGLQFVSHKITLGAVRIKLGLQDKLCLGNLSSKRDLGYAKDYVEAVYKIMQHNEPDDWVVATGRTYTIREFLQTVFDYLGLEVSKHVVLDKEMLRPLEVPSLRGNSQKIKTLLGWEPKTGLYELIKIMVGYDMKNERNNLR